MTIPLLSSTHRRTVIIASAGTPPAALTAGLKLAGFALRQVDRSQLPTTDSLVQPECCAVLINVESGRAHELKPVIGPIARSAAENGLLCGIVCATGEIAAARGVIAAAGVSPQLADCFASGDFTPLTNRIVAHNPGPVPNRQLKIEGAIISGEDKALFSRAFTDFSSVQLSEPLGGRTASVFRVAAVPGDDAYRPRPLPYFAKVGKRESISVELRKYREWVEGFVPFHLRPNFIPSRCILGHQRGIIVGSFVEDSVPLHTALRRPGSGAELLSLFEDALRGWRSQADFSPAYLSDSSQQKWNLRASLAAEPADNAPSFNPAKVPTQTLKLAKQHGLTREVEEIWSALGALGPIKHKRGPIHGDLHALNVHVRRGDAILIDFAAVSPSGPLSFDAATLEVSLTLADYYSELPARIDQQQEWMKLMATLYMSKKPGQLLPPPASRTSREWLWSAIRHIRMFALTHEEQSSREYPEALAIAMLRKAAHAPDEGIAGDDVRRAMALVYADHLTGVCEAMK